MLRNQKIVLTGANSGIGLEFLRIVSAEKSNTVLAADIRSDNLTGFGANVVPFICDISSQEGVDALFEKAAEVLGDITLFYANAGFAYFEVMRRPDWDRTRRIFETNVFSPLYSFQKYAAFLAGRPGRFAVSISAMGKMAMPGYALYSATKFALHGFYQAARLEMPANLRLTCLYPVATNTAFFKTANPGKYDKPFPMQSARLVAEKMAKGLEKGKKSVVPCKLFTLSSVLFAVLPFTRTLYWKREKAKLDRLLASEGVTGTGGLTRDKMKEERYHEKD